MTAGAGGRWGLWAAVGLVVAVNAVVLARVGLNRAGEPTARIEFTERELALPYYTQNEENTGLALTFEWDQPEPTKTWLDRAKLEELGFDVPSRPKWERVRQSLPRAVFVVLEHDGDSWRRWLAGRETKIERLAGELERGEATTRDLRCEREGLALDRVGKSRLFAVDAGRDPEALQRRYPEPSRFVVVPAWVSLVDARPRGGDSEEAERLIYGRIDALEVEKVHVPLPLRPLLDARLAERRARGERRRPPPTPGSDAEECFPGTQREPPAYRATVAWGRRYEPWLVEVETLPPPAAED